MRTAWTVERYEAAHCSNTNDTLTTVPQVTALGYHFWIFAGVLFACYIHCCVSLVCLLVFILVVTYLFTSPTSEEKYSKEVPFYQIYKEVSEMKSHLEGAQSIGGLEKTRVTKKAKTKAENNVQD